MSNLNFLIFLNTYGDKNPSNAPDKNYFRWEREINGFSVNNPTSLSMSLAPGESRSLFNGSRTLTQNNTTQYSISLVPFTTNTYQLTWVGGAAPSFRATRSIGTSATTVVMVTINGPVITYTSTAGNLFSLLSAGVQVGDFVRIGSQFNPSNQGEWQIVAFTDNSFSVVNPAGAAEGPITLGASYASQVKIYGAAGVQINDTLSISGGFSLVTQGSYTVTSVADTFLQFSSLNALPQEGPITTQSIAVYYLAKRLIYLESDQKVSLSVNGNDGNEILPLIDSAGISKPGMFMQSGILYSISITNESLNTANVFIASVE